MITRDIQLDVTPTPGELALCFVNMDADQHAEFFSRVAALARVCDRDFGFQLQAISDSNKLSRRGREIMQQIGEYGGVE